MSSLQSVGTPIQQPQQIKTENKQQAQVIQLPRAPQSSNQQIGVPSGDRFVRQNSVQQRPTPVVSQPMTPQQYRILQEMNSQRAKKQSSTDSKAGLTWALGIASSAIILLYFGKSLYKDFMDSRKMKQVEKMFAQSQNLADDLVKQIEACKDEVLRKAAASEFQKEHMRSEKRIKDILALDKLKNTPPEEVDIRKAIEIMDKKIIGMEEAKGAILDFLFQYNYNIKNGIKNEKPLVLCLDGPAGVGKTTISEVLAEALGMHYKKISLAGAHGKSLIRGTEAQFVNAAPGGIVNGQLEGETRRVLYCLDEVDKAGTSDQHGNILDTLLSLFDDQAKFVDDHLDVPIDISQSIFVLTTNNFKKLSEPLQNRVKKIQIGSYDNAIKSQIAELKMKNLLQKQKLDESKVKVKDDAYQKLAELTTDNGGREVTRNAQKLIERIIRMMELGENKGKVIKVDAKFVEEQLAPKTSSYQELRRRILEGAV